MAPRSDPSQSMPATFPFVGREREMGILHESLARAIAGHGHLVMVSGEAGIGKTSLVRAFIGETAKQNALILQGHCYDLTTTPPYGPWLEIADRYPDDTALPDVPEVLKRGTGIGDLPSQLALFESVRDFLASLSRTRPLVLVLEDLHWADQESLDLLRYLARHLDGRRILLLATYRDDEVTRQHLMFALLPNLVRESEAVRVELGPLSPESVEALVMSRWPLLAKDQERLVDYLLTYAEGHPLFTVEVLRTMEQHGFVHHPDDSFRLADLSELPVPTLVRQVIERHMAQLDEESQHYLKVAAVIGHEVPLDVWQAVGGMPDSDLLAVLDQAIALHLLEASTTNNAVRFVHALTREVVYASILPPQRRIWHQLVAETLASAPNPILDSVAYHFQQAGDQRAVDWFIRAGEWAEHTFAWNSAVDRFLTVSILLETHESRSRERGWLLFRAARLSYYIDPAGGVENLDEAIRVAALAGDGVLRASSQFRRGHLRCFTGAVQRGIEEMAEGVKLWAKLPVEQKRSCEYWNLLDADLQVNLHLGTLMLWMAIVGRYQECLQHAETFLAQIHPERERLAQPHHWLWPGGYVGIGMTYATMGWPVQAREMFELARESFQAMGNLVMESLSLMSLLRDVLIPYELERVTERYRIADEIEAAWVRAEGGMRSLISPRLQVIPLLLTDGAWDEIKGLASPGIVTHTNVTRQLELVTALGLIARHQGDAELAWEQVRTALPDGPATEPGNSFFVHARESFALAIELSIDAEDLEDARAWLVAHDCWLEWSGGTRWQPEQHLLWARYHHARGQFDESRDRASRALDLASDPRQPLVLIAAHRFLGQLDTEARQYSEAEAHLQKSLDLAQTCAAPFERALTLLVLAVLRATTGEIAYSKALLDEVRTICVPLNARPTLARANALTAKLHSESRRTDNPAGLTPREIEVLQLVAQGLPDKEIAENLFISHHTVMRHVSHILTKLEVESRTAAAARAVRDALI
jgi:DNA-binding CsgD family transcriptional regulator